MSTIYVLEGSSGSYWDDAYNWIISVYDNLEMAEEDRDKYNESIKWDKDKYSPEEYERLDKLEDEIYEKTNSIIIEPNFPQEVIDFIKWRDLKYQELHPSEIKTFELNKRI